MSVPICERCGVPITTRNCAYRGDVPVEHSPIDECIVAAKVEIARLREVVRTLRKQSRDIVLDRNRLLAGFAWTAKVQSAAEAEWDEETERLVNGATPKKLPDDEPDLDDEERLTLTP